MAHYIAELIHDAEKASSEEGPVKMQACSKMILHLWRHRYEMLNGKGPLRQLEPILRALESLDPDNDAPRYFRSAIFAAEAADESDDTKVWLELIDDLDYTARSLIRYCLTQATETAFDRSARWVALAEAAGADGGVESWLFRMTVEENSLLKETDPDEIVSKCLEDRIARLEEFAERATALVSELRQQLKRAQDSDQGTAEY